MIRGAKPKPTQLRALEGSKVVDIVCPSAPLPPAVPEPPDYLTAYAQEEWHRVAPILYRLRMLSEIDTPALVGYCDAYSTWRSAREMLNTMSGQVSNGFLIITKKSKDHAGGNVIQSPLLSVMNKARLDFLRFAVELGMSPTARSRIDEEASGRAQADDPAAKFLNRVR
jgi:P27 family predicted phage terminase small subunit